MTTTETLIPPLHEAVDRTASKLLDTPAFVPLFRTTSSFFNKKYSRIYAALEPLGYARLSFWDSLDPADKPASGCTLEVHPLVHKYFKKYGEQYVQLLEARQRLINHEN